MFRSMSAALTVFLLLLGQIAFSENMDPSADFRPYGKNLLKADGTPRTVAILLYDGMTAQDFIGIYTTLNFASGPDLKILFVGKKKGLVHDERGRLHILVDHSIDQIKRADIFIVPGGNHTGMIKDKKMLKWVKSMYDQSEYTASICTGGVILAAAGATTGKNAGVAWIAREALAPLGVHYVPTPPLSQDGKYFSAAGAAAGFEIGFTLLETLTGSRTLSEISEFAAEWNPHMLYNAGNPQTASPQIIGNFLAWTKSDPLFLKLRK